MKRRNRGVFWMSAAFAAVLMLGAGVARADYSLTVTTTGMLTSLSDPGNILGAGTSLSGGDYTIRVYYADLGGATVTTDPGVSSAYNDVAASGTITVTVNGHTLTTGFAGNGIANLLEQPTTIIDTVTGSDASGNQALVIQTISATDPFTLSPDLQQDLSHTLLPTDSGSDFFNYATAGFAAVISLSGVPGDVTLQVPEPAGSSLLGGALLGLGAASRRRLR